MVYYNSFRYGEISRRNAGRFDSEFYRYGCFTFRNMVTDFTGSARRRPPIRKLIDTDAEMLVAFPISEVLSYLIGIGTERLRIYRDVLGEFKEVANIAYPSSRKLTISQIKELRWAQYYTRMYFVHRDFRPFFIDFDTSSEIITISEMTVVLNQDAKAKLWFTPAYVENENGEEMPSLEGRVLYEKMENGIQAWYLDADYKEKYEYSVTYPPIHGSGSYILGYDDFEDDDLMTKEGCYPSGISIINDSIYLYATTNSPQSLWKSRFLGSSQWIDGFNSDSMHDFVNFQVVWTEGKEMLDASEMPMKDLSDSSGEPVFEQENGHDKWFLPDKDENGNYTYARRVYQYYEDEDINTDNFIWVLNPDDPENSKYTIQDPEADYPIKKPIKTLDLTDPDKLIRTQVSVDYTATDSCGLSHIEMNTGKMDRINDIIPGFGYIFVLTSSSEHRLPGGFSAVNNLRTVDGNAPYKTYGSQAIRAVAMNSSILFLQKSGVLREFYTYQGYMADSDASAFNHDILSGGVFQAVVKNTPDPIVYFVMEDGTMVVLDYDKENGIQAFARWDMEGRDIASAACMSGVIKDRMTILVKSDDESWIGYLDEDEEEDFSDEGKIDYESDIISPYTEVIDQNLAFGKYKKAISAVIRPYHTGRIYTGNAGDRLVLSDIQLGDSDYRTMLTGTSRSQHSLEIKAYRNEPMNILCYSFEVM